MVETSEISVKLEIPRGMENKVVFAMREALKEFIEDVEFLLAKEILEESELTEEQAKELGDEVSLSSAKRHL